MAGKRHKKGPDVPALPGDKAHGTPGYVPLTPEEVRLRLLEVRDIALNQTLTIARAGHIDMLARWQNAYERAAGELSRLEDRAQGATGGVVRLLVNNLDVDRIEFGSNGPKSEA